MRAVFAYTGELDEWLREQSPELPAAETDDQTAPPAAPAEAGPVPSSSVRIPARMAVLGVLALAALVTFVVARRGPPPFGTLTARPITADPGDDSRYKRVRAVDGTPLIRPGRGIRPPATVRD